MKVVNAIRNFFSNIKSKRLPSAELFNTNIMPIACGGKDREKIASIIKDEINHYIDFYRVLLDEYDGICINNADNEFQNPLKVDGVDFRTSYTFHNLQTHTTTTKVLSSEEIKNRILNHFGNAILSKYSERGIKINFDKMRTEYDRKIDYTYEDKKSSDELYYCIINKRESSQYGNLLCRIKDWKGLRLLLISKSDIDFCKQYLDNNLFVVLNKAIELYTDRSYNNFFERNIDIISDAVDLTRSYLKDYIVECFNLMIWSLERDQSGEKDVNKILNEYEEQQKNDKKARTKEAKIDKEKSIELVIEILNYIDPEQKLSELFLEKMQSGKIIIFNEHEKSEVFEKLKEIMGETDAEKIIVEGACHIPQYGICVIPIINRITDVPTIIHEFIHQTFHNSGKPQGYSVEIPSVFFGKIAMDYLINNGFEQYADILQDSFSSRKINDAGNNSVINDFVEITKIKHDEGNITLQNILTDDRAKQMNAMEQLLHEGRSVDDTKKEYAKARIKSFANRSQELKDKIVKYCSYALGTFFAERYSDDEAIKKKMLELISNPEFELQTLLDSITRKGQEIETKKDDRSENQN